MKGKEERHGISKGRRKAKKYNSNASVIEDSKKNVIWCRTEGCKDEQTEETMTAYRSLLPVIDQ